MQMITSISSKGQITIPIKVRKYLGVDTNDKVAFIIESNGNVKVTPAKYPNIKSLSGAAGKLPKPLSWQEMKKIAYEDRF